MIRINLYIPEPQEQALKEEAEERGISYSEIIRRAVDEYLDKPRLTTAHSASSYGIPVLVIRGTAYGTADMLPNGMTGAQWANIRREDLDAERELIKRFLMTI